MGRRASVLSAPTLAEAPDRPSPSVASEAATVDQEPIPVYRTRIPPAATLRYAIRRGLAQGSGELQWRPTASGYSARLDASIGAGSVYSQRSEGAFDAAGLAPARYTDRGPRRQLLAANFQRESGKVSFSGSSAAFPLLPGSQDRLTWLVQLAAVLAAEPERLAVDAVVAMAVVGVRGEPMTWVFRSTGPDPVATDAGEVTAIRLVRESRGPYDPGIEVWVDPQRHHLPVKVRFGSDSEARTFEMVLQSLTLDP